MTRGIANQLDDHLWVSDRDRKPAKPLVAPQDIGGPTSGSAGRPVAVQYPVRMLGRPDGLPSGQVHQAVVDDDGSLWMATPNGLARSDGSRVVTFSMSDGLSTHGLRCVRVDATGVVWIGSDVGVDRRLPDGTVEAMFGGWRWGLANDIAIADDGTVWVASSEGLIRWSAIEGWVPEPDLLGGPVHRVTIDGANKIWLSTRHRGLLTQSAGGWKAPEVDDWQLVGTVLCVVGAADGSLIVGGSSGAANIDPFGRIVRALDTINSAVHAALVDGDELWLGTGNDLRRYVSTEAGWGNGSIVLESNRVNHIASDDHGNVWAATDSNGVAKVEAVRHVIERPDLGVGSVFAIRRDPNGDLLVAGDQATGRFRHSERASFQPMDDLAAERIWDVWDDGAGTVWAAAETGLTRVHTSHATRVHQDHPVLGGPARVLLGRGDGLWVGTLNGLARRSDDGTVTTILDDGGCSLGYVYTLVAQGDTVWIGTLGNGLWKYQRSKLERMIGEGLTPTGNTYAIAISDDGTVAVMQDNRAVILDQEQDPRVLATSDEGLMGWTAVFDGNGSLWVGGSSGLTEYDLGSGDLRRRVTLWMGTEGWEFTTSRSLCFDDDGRLLCGLNSGLTIVDLDALDVLASTPPTVQLCAVAWFNAQPKSLNGVWTVREGRWSVEIRVSSTWSHREATRLFRYRLLGFEPTWSEPTASPHVQFTSLPPGIYNLEVQAHSGITGWGPPKSVATFDVARTRSIRQLSRRRSASRVLRRLTGENHELEQRVRERTIELRATRDKLESTNEELVTLARTDPLTNLANRRRFDGALTDALDRTSVTGLPLSLLMIDVDEFKAYNDHVGHLAGDECLRRIALVMAAAVGDDYLLARYGGEEFAVLLPEVDATTAMCLAERVRASVSASALAHPHSETANIVTVSIGVATKAAAPDATADGLIGTADRALYEAKRAGRNRCHAATTEINLQ